ncbi:Chloride channel protein [Anaerovibrio sp. JC8]|nr:Chloride channel protein [Anaerovibrio sp. JC8]
MGVGAGGVIALFRYLLGLSDKWRPDVYKMVADSFRQGDYGIPVLYLAVFLIIAWLLMKIVHNEPMCTGSGIPQIKGILMGRMNMRWLSVLVSKLIGGVLAIGSGMSLGREGPSVQLGACVGQGVSRSVIRTRYEERILMTAGSGAGLAAAFNAPLAGVIFGFEEMSKSFSPVVLMASVTAAVTATTVSQVIFGAGPVFHIGDLEIFPLNMFGILIVLGIYIGLLGRIFNPSLLFSMNAYDRLGLSGIKRPLLPLLLAAGLGFVLPEILGGGNLLVDALSTNYYPLYFIILLFVGKFIFTMLCFGSGVPGGIFLPMLVLGAAGGAVFSSVLVSCDLLPYKYAGDLIVFGMAAYFAAVVKAPITGSVLIMEMTGSFNHLLALICVSMTAYLVADLTGGKPVYEELLSRALSVKDQRAAIASGRRVSLELVVSSGSVADKALIKEIKWPEQTVVVDIKRGLQRINPMEDARLYAGDFVYVLTNDTDISRLKDMLEKESTPRR